MAWEAEHENNYYLIMSGMESSEPHNPGLGCNWGLLAPAEGCNQFHHTPKYPETTCRGAMTSGFEITSMIPNSCQTQSVQLQPVPVQEGGGGGVRPN